MAAKILMTEVLDELNTYFSKLKENSVQQKKIVKEISMFFDKELSLNDEKIFIDFRNSRVTLKDIEGKLTEIENIKEKVNSLIIVAKKNKIYKK